MVSVSRLLNGPSAGAYGISGLWKQLNFGAPFGILVGSYMVAIAW